jgi:hypothetical protein
MCTSHQWVTFYESDLGYGAQNTVFLHPQDVQHSLRGKKPFFNSRPTMEEEMARQTRSAAVLLATSLLTAPGALAQDASKDVQKQIDEVRSVLPKFAIPMREVGDRFQNMYFAAEGGNWGLAAYMSKYMNGAMNPAKVTKPNEYQVWKSFYESAFAPVTKAIEAKDFNAFKEAYSSAITACNGCHAGMGYGFIKVVKLGAPADSGMDYNLKSNPGDVPP